MRRAKEMLHMSAEETPADAASLDHTASFGDGPVADESGNPGDDQGANGAPEATEGVDSGVAVEAGALGTEEVTEPKAEETPADAAQDDEKPSDCTGKPSECPNNEGYGCTCGSGDEPKETITDSLVTEDGKVWVEAEPAESVPLSAILYRMSEMAEAMEESLAKQELKSLADADTIKGLEADVKELTGTTSEAIAAALAVAKAADAREDLRHGKTEKAFAWLAGLGWQICEYVPGAGPRYSKDRAKYGDSSLEHAVQQEWEASVEAWRKAK
jgi:hypothetical protein